MGQRTVVASDQTILRAEAGCHGGANLGTWADLTGAAADFVKRYRPAFLRQFRLNAQICLEPSELGNTRLPGLVGSAYDLQFDAHPDQNGTGPLRRVFTELSQTSPHSRKVLKQCWLGMVKDFSQYLMNGSGRLEDLKPLVDRIFLTARFLKDASFDSETEHVSEKPRIDRSDPGYMQLLESFSRYVGREKKDEEAEQLIIHTYYRGMPIQFAAEVIAADVASVAFHVHPYQAVALFRLGQALIQSPLHQASFRAYTGFVDLPRRTAVFTHLLAYEGPVERRAYVRVEPLEALDVEVQAPGLDVIGRLIDVSAVAAAVGIDPDDATKLRNSGSLTAAFSLPGEGDVRTERLEIEGTVGRIMKGGVCRVVIHFEKDPATENRLSTYVSTRQLQILEELRTVSEGP